MIAAAMAFYRICWIPARRNQQLQQAPVHTNYQPANQPYGTSPHSQPIVYYPTNQPGGPPGGGMYPTAPPPPQGPPPPGFRV